MIDPVELEPVAMRAFPATEQEHLGGWTLRSHDSLPNRRVNSAWAVGGPGLALADAIGVVENWYRERGKRSIVKTDSSGSIDGVLEGWQVEAPTGVYTRPAEQSSVSAVTFLPPEELDSWALAFTRVRGFDPSRARGLVSSYQGLENLGLATIEEAGSPIAVGLGVLDGGWVGLFDIATDPAHQRRGLGSLVTKALVDWGAARGAEVAYLQVEDENEAAIRLYEGLGFERAYGYEYRVKKL